MKIVIIIGTRPEIIKMAPVYKKLNKNDTTLIYSGQHYDYNMGLKFFEEFDMPVPEYKMKLTKIQNTTTDRATQIGDIMIKLSKIITSIKPDVVMTHGDTNTTLAAAITSLKCGIPLSHIEAGIRSNDWEMPEEHNRIMVDHISEILFAPTNHTKKNLEDENVHGKIFVTGNTAIDAVEQNIENIEKKTNISIKFDDYVLATLHRGSNVDNKKILSSIINALLKSNVNIVFPVHPRTKKRLIEFGLYNKIEHAKNICLLQPVGYFDMLFLMKKCRFIITDSGGIQEESTSPKLRKKVLVIRKTTDRPEAVKAGFSELIGTNMTRILQSIKENINDSSIHSNANPYGKGNASEKIIRILKKYNFKSIN